jgi:5-methylcytosine-specific restriction endonuclease McrA
MFDEKNLQVLCYTCHKEKTKEDMKEIAKQRKIEKVKLKNKQVNSVKSGEAK